MIPYIGCETAREMLEAFVDGELAMADQVAVESHLRWCRTCSARVEDLRLIGSALRRPAHAPASEETRALSALQSAVLARVRAEREQSFPVRVRAMFDDMRLLWPAMGASAALAACLFVSLSVLQAATAENPESLAAMIERLDRPATPTMLPANPGSDQNPLRLDGRINAPRALEGTAALDAQFEDEVAYAVSAVVTREGRISTYDLLQTEHATSRPAGHGAEDVSAVLDVVKRSRFAPAEAAGGTKVAVNMVWLLVRTTAKGHTPTVDARRAIPRATEDVVVKPEVEEAPVVPSTEADDPPSTTA